MNMPNDPSNTFDFSDLPADNIERVEILRGPQSTLYGSDALAGVIDIITKRGYGKPKFFLSASGGAYSTYREMAGLNGSINRLNYSLTFSRLNSKGFSSASSKYGNTEKDGTANSVFSSRIGYGIAKNFSLNFTARFSKAKTDFDQHGGEFGDDPTYIYNLEEQAYRAEADLSLLNKFWDMKIGGSFMRNVRKYSFDSTLYNPASSNSLYDGRKIKFDWQNDFHINKDNLLTLGIENEQEKAASQYYYFSYGSDYPSVFPENKSSTTGIFLQDQMSFGGNFFNTLGIRYDKHNRFGSIVTYKIAPAYIIWQTGTKFKASFGTGFKAPSLFYLFDPAYGNPDLKPEKSTGWDAGIEQYFWNKDLTFGVTYFKNTFSDLFGFDNNFKTINTEKAETSGIEFYLTSEPLSNLTLKVNYTYTNTKDLSNSADNGKQLLRRPHNKAGFNLNYNFNNRANVNLDLIYVGNRDDKDFSTYPATRVVLSNYTIVNLAASFNINHNLQVFGRIENLFNKYYEEVLGFATPGASAYIGVKLSAGIL